MSKKAQKIPWTPTNIREAKKEGWKLILDPSGKVIIQRILDSPFPNCWPSDWSVMKWCRLRAQLGYITPKRALELVKSTEDLMRSDYTGVLDKKTAVVGKYYNK